MHIAVCVCTCQRPQMLRSCLTSISHLICPEGAQLSVIVIDNESEPNNRTIVESFPGFIYHHEPKRGIANARNAALEQALSVKADFIAFTDDDAEPSEPWIVDLLAEQQKYGVDIVQGHTVYVYPEPRPKWIDPKQPAAVSGVSTRAWVSTNNVLFSAHLVHSNGMGLRFDKRFNATGGEDSDFFGRARDRGARLAVSNIGIVTERVVPERCTYMSQVRRQFQYATGATISELDKGKHRTVLVGAIQRVAHGCLAGFIALILGPFSTERFTKNARRFGWKIAYAAGQISVLLGYRYQPYRAIDGF